MAKEFMFLHHSANIDRHGRRFESVEPIQENTLAALEVIP